MNYFFPPYRSYEDIPFGFWYVGFFAVVLSFFNLSINFFSHFSLLLGVMTTTLPEMVRNPRGLDLFFSGIFSVYYLVSAPLFFMLGVRYWNFLPAAKRWLSILFVIDATMFIAYTALAAIGLYLYDNQYFKIKAMLYIALMIAALYFVHLSVDDTAKRNVKKMA